MFPISAAWNKTAQWDELGMTRGKARHRLALAVVGLAMILAVPVQSGPYEDGESAFARGDETKGWRLMWAAAKHGDVRAQTLIAHLDLKAEVYVEAAHWFRKVAEHETADPLVLHAQFQLGWLYETGKGVPEDYAEAVNWYRRAAERGHARAQQNLGIMYLTGRGVPQDYVLAHMWLNLASARDTPGTKERDNALKARALAESVMTRGQIAEAQRLAREWVPIGGP